MFDVVLDKQAKRFLNGSEQATFERITKKLNSLRENPFPSKSKRLRGTLRDFFRIRIGEYRVLYEVVHEKKIIRITKIDKRSRVYS